MPTITQKRAASFRYRFRLSEQDLSAAVLRSQIRGGNLVADLDVRTLDDTGWIELSAPAEATAVWPRMLLACDVRAELPGGEVFYTATFYISIIEEITS